MYVLHVLYEKQDDLKKEIVTREMYMLYFTFSDLNSRVAFIVCLADVIIAEPLV